MRSMARAQPLRPTAARARTRLRFGRRAQAHCCATTQCGQPPRLPRLRAYPAPKAVPRAYIGLGLGQGRGYRAKARAAQMGPTPQP